MLTSYLYSNKNHLELKIKDYVLLQSELKNRNLNLLVNSL